MHTLLDLLRCGSFIREFLVFSINHLDGLFVKLKIDYAGLIEYRASGAVLNRLRHVIDVDVVTENLLCITVFQRDWSTRKPNKRRIR